MTEEEKSKAIMDFLHKRVFDPILNDINCSNDVKQGVRYTITRMNALNAKGKVQFFWSAIVGTERSIPFANKMKKLGYIRFEDVLEDFRNGYNDKWLRS